MQTRLAKGLVVYRKACQLAMKVFDLSRDFPREARLV
jgi:peroxiredoxin family protein